MNLIENLASKEHRTLPDSAQYIQLPQLQLPSAVASTTNLTPALGEARMRHSLGINLYNNVLWFRFLAALMFLVSSEVCLVTLISTSWKIGVVAVYSFLIPWLIFTVPLSSFCFTLVFVTIDRSASQSLLGLANRSYIIVMVFLAFLALTAVDPYAGLRWIYRGDNPRGIWVDLGLIESDKFCGNACFSSEVLIGPPEFIICGFLGLYLLGSLGVALSHLFR